MRIAWVTPCHPQSSIWRFSRLLRDALKHLGHEVTIVRLGDREVLAAPPDGEADKTLNWEELRASPRDSEKFDIFIYNAGDNHRFHAGAAELLETIPGIVIFHDAHLLNLYLHCRRLAGHPPVPDPLLDEIHGAGTAARIQAIFAEENFLEATQPFPMTAWLARRADGAIAHASFYEQRLRAECPGPVAVIPLAYDSLDACTPLSRRGAHESFHILTFGHVNWNRRVDSVLRAIGQSDLLRSHAIYRVVGAIEDREQRRLSALAKEWGVTSVDFVGPVSNAALATEFEAADVICALRRPALEGASASAIEAMLSGRPVLVSATGFYRDLPENLVYFVRAESEVADLQHHLERLFHDRTLGAETGAAAAFWAARKFSADAYANSLICLLTEVLRVQPILRSVESVARNLAGFSVEPKNSLVSRIAREMELLFLDRPA